MHRRPFGKTGLTVGALGLGTAELGFDEDVTEEKVKGLVLPAIDAGLDVIDTASAYLASEELLGKVLKGRRSAVHLFTKCGAADGFSRSDWSARGIRGQLERSLTALQTDRVDLLQLHSCGVDVLERGEAIDVLEALKREGKTRFIGYSGDGLAAQWAVKSGRFDSLQTSINVADQQVLEQILPAAAQAQLAVIAKRPIANVAWRSGDQAPAEAYHRTYWQRLRTLDYDFLRTPLEEAAAIALRFTVFTPGITTAIVGSSTPGRWNQNLRSLEAGPLSSSELDAIRARWKARAEASWTGQQ